MKLQKDNKGFTIIEVLIVLAIGGLMMLVVFLAVPALQRNSRNTQRTNDVSLIGAALNECLTNRNGQVPSCDTTAELQTFGLDDSKLRQITPAANIVVTAAAPAPPAVGNTNHANVGFRARCAADGATLVGTTNTRQAAILYRVEVASNNDGALRCIEV